MKIKDTYDFEIPGYAVCPIVYGDYSSYELENEDIKNIEAFLAELPPDGTWDFSNDESSFTRCPAFGLACDTVSAKYHIFE